MRERSRLYFGFRQGSLQRTFSSRCSASAWYACDVFTTYDFEKRMLESEEGEMKDLNFLLLMLRARLTIFFLVLLLVRSPKCIHIEMDVFLSFPFHMGESSPVVVNENEKSTRN